MKAGIIILIITILNVNLSAEKILIMMDDSQTDHLRAYGLVYWVLQHDLKGEWLLNYRSGSFLLDYTDEIKEKADLLGVKIEIIDDVNVTAVYQQIEENNMNRIQLEKAPRIAVYAPSFAEPWDDAVRMALEYAQIPYTRLWDEEVLSGVLSEYDWLHLHHEDFTGQYGKFYASFRNAEWYKLKTAKFKHLASQLGYPSVQEEKRAVAKMIQGYVAKGGFLFAMCSATDTIDIALAADGLDIIPTEIDGTPISPNAQQKLDYNKCFAFTGFELVFEAMVYEFSNIDIDIIKEGLYNLPDTFSLFDFSAKIDPVPAMLVQDHQNVIKGFLGQTTAFNKAVIKESVTVLAETPGTQRIRYIHGEFADGTFTFLGGHDPEDYRHLVGDPTTDLSLYKNSPGYRLILNNVLYPAARKKNRKT